MIIEYQHNPKFRVDQMVYNKELDLKGFILGVSHREIFNDVYEFIYNVYDPFEDIIVKVRQSNLEAL